MDLELTESIASIIIARESFLTNLFHCISVLSAFQLARGYAPSVLVIPSSIVTGYVLDAHIATVGARALQKALRSNDNNVE